MSSKKTGDSGEILALAYLQKKGYKIIETNYHVRGGEIDIVAEKGNKIIFIEVKYRKSLYYGTPEESMTTTKKQKFYCAIQNYINTKNISEENIQADFISIIEKNGAPLIEHYENIELV